jgi:hypothetical protein
MNIGQPILTEDEQHYPTRSTQTTHSAVAHPQWLRRGHPVGSRGAAGAAARVDGCRGES